jgi:hypothetical protein
VRAFQQLTGGFVLRNWTVVRGKGQCGMEHTACVLRDTDGENEEREKNNIANKNK